MTQKYMFQQILFIQINVDKQQTELLIKILLTFDDRKQLVTSWIQNFPIFLFFSFQFLAELDL